MKFTRRAHLESVAENQTALMSGLMNAAKEVREHGTFGYLDTSLATPEMYAFLRE